MLTHFHFLSLFSTNFLFIYLMVLRNFDFTIEARNMPKEMGL